MFYPGDKVVFDFCGEDKTGEVFVYDFQGGGECFGVCASCDIFADDGVLYKHIPENAISRAGPDKKQILRPPVP